MSSIIESVYDEFKKKPDIASFIKLFSVIMWEKISFVRRQNGLKFYEVTATQNLLFQFKLLESAFPTKVQMFEAVDEKTNGNDIELFIETKEGSIFFAVQAKIVKSNGVYNSIEHPPKRKRASYQQIDSLIEYATSKVVSGVAAQGIPLYLFYNSSSDVTSLGSNYQVYGCSYMDARDLVGTYYVGRKWKRSKPSFNALHPLLGKPFHELFNLVGQPKRKLIELGIKESYVNELTDFSLPEFNEIWKSTSDLAYQGDGRGRLINTQSEAFNPGHRIIVRAGTFEEPLGRWLFT